MWAPGRWEGSPVPRRRWAAGPTSSSM
ncbi:MAG: hypothetical protein ACKO8O_19265 [Betaproteobacteria bacterium]